MEMTKLLIANIKWEILTYAITTSVKKLNA